MLVRRLVVLWFAVALLALAPSGVHAQSKSTLVGALDILKLLPAAQKGPALAADVTGEGHWTFVNTQAERFTAASAEEMKRVLPTLAPDAVKPGVRLTLVLTEDSVFLFPRHVLLLPLAADRRTDLMIAVNGTAYPLLRRGPDRQLAEIRPNLLLELSDRLLFDEAVWQLAHPLKRTGIRVLALEPGGPIAIPTSPRLDTATKRPLTDIIAPPALAGALRSLAGQTAILTARRDGELLAFRPASGPEATLSYWEVIAAAEAADVNLVLLQSATPRQPGTRGWWWQTVSVSRLDSALGRDHLADFLNALGSPQTRLVVSARIASGGRIALNAVALKDDSGPTTGIGEALSDLVSNIAGQVVVSGVEASLRDRSRQTELDRRLVPGVSSLVQWIYLGLLAMGLAGHGLARRWWIAVWPLETREGYGNAFGFLAARIVRAAAYAGLFMPLVAVASAPLSLLAALKGRPRGDGGESGATPASTLAHDRG